MTISAGLAVTITIMAVMIIGMIIAILVIFFRKRKRQLNNIDFILMDMTGTGCTIFKEIGRRQWSNVSGYEYVTCGFMPNSVKRKLGPHVNDNHMFPNKFGNGRRTCIGLWKDGVFAPGDIKALQQNEKGQKVFVPLTEIINPESLSITPIMYEALRLQLDNNKAAQSIFKEKSTMLTRLLPFIGVGIFALCIVGVIVVLVIAMNQTPPFAAQFYNMKYGALMSNLTLPPG
jgi:hypothetical protein